MSSVEEAPKARVAFSGEPGVDSDEAAQAWFGEGVETLPRHGFREVTKTVVSGEAEFGVLPIESTFSGSVGAALDALLETDLEIEGEVVLPVHHCLLGLSGTTPAALRKVVSDPVALAQCQRFFEDNGEVEAVAVHDTASAARLVVEGGDPAVGALASETVARRHGMVVLARDLQDRMDNSTRFFLVRQPERAAPVPALAHPKSLAVFETGDRPGALMEVLHAFARRGVNLTRLESRPGRLPWTYRFVAEVAADPRDDQMAAALEDVRTHAMTLVVRGPFAAAAPTPPEDRGAADVPRPEMEPWRDRLDRTRRAITDVDEALIRLLAERLRLARRAQGLRKESGVGGVDPGREAQVLRRAAELARREQLPEEPVRDVFWRIVALCKPVKDS